MAEEWRDVVGYEGIYQVSSLGRVMRTSCRGVAKQRILCTIYHSRYMVVTLYKNGKGKQMLVHRLVAQAFIPNPDKLSQVNHKNGNRKDNRVENLEWVTAEENIMHSYYALGHIEQTGRKIRCVESGKVYSSTKEAERDTGIWSSNISMAIHGKIQQTKGLHWEIVE